MKKILFLPLLQMPSGHHQVADALIRSLEKRLYGIVCEKVDFLSYVNKWMEKIVTGTYMKWIYYAPQTYERVYKHCACTEAPVQHYHMKWYELLFLERMEQLLYEEKPDLIVCTHAFPSFLISRLKAQKKFSTPVINVYTDFFINKIWGRREIDYHFVPTDSLKNELIQKNNIHKDRIFVTGIPVDEHFHHTNRKRTASPSYKILISGGSNGLGHILPLLQQIKKKTNFHYFVLCGNNKYLLNTLMSWQMDHIQPLPYVSSREEMSDWYEQVDAIITKPGGVTISEALWKKVLIFIHSALPGQEEMNLRYLESQKLAYRLHPHEPYEKQLLGILNNEEEKKNWLNQIDTYYKNMETAAWKKILEFME
jgi:UDP-N-acetylglucosamine:LPS N-acetylglucosamine transferase